MLDGLGWEQLQARAAVHPDPQPPWPADPITTVAPSTTATALTSIATGLTPGEHGVIGYRMAWASGEVLNVLRWSIVGATPARRIPPEKVQPHEAFFGHRPAIVTRAEFTTSGFTQAHLDGVRFTGYRITSTLVAEIGRALRRNEPFVYAYYDGIDKVAHEYGLGEIYDAELRSSTAWWPTSSTSCRPAPRSWSPPTTARSTSATTSCRLAPEVMAQVAIQSGEGRFRWLHARPGRARRAARRGHRAPRRHRLGASPGTRRSTRAGSAPRSPTPPARASATSPSSPATTSRSSTRTTPARTC